MVGGGDVRTQVKTQKCVRLMSMREGEKGRDHVITRTYLRVFVQGVVRSKRTLPTCERTICRDTHTRAHMPVYILQVMDNRGNSNGQAGRNTRLNAHNTRKRNSILTSRNSLTSVNFTALSCFAGRGPIKSWHTRRTVSPVGGEISTLVINQNPWQPNLPTVTVSQPCDLCKVYVE